MGNRGCLHDANRTLSGPRWTTTAWLACQLAFGGRRRELMRPGYYTELFFLDEVTALAAGHRPCAECRRAAFRQFIGCWAAGNRSASVRASAAELDRAIHAQRVNRRHGKITYSAAFADLPDGVMFKANDSTLLKWRGVARRWSFEGYGPLVPLGSDIVTVLTPRPIADALQAGYQPEVHRSAETAQI